MASICFFAPLSYSNAALDGLAASARVFEKFGDEERDRIDRISNADARSLSLGGLLALSAGVDDCCGPDFERKIVRDKFGKPRFDGGDAPVFSISHSGGLSVAALSRCGEIGVDIEQIDDRRDICKIANRFFSQAEKERLSLAQDKERAFYAIWTAKEAMMKLGGEGMISVMSADSVCAENSKERFFLKYRLLFEGEEYALTVCASRFEEITMIGTDGIDFLV